MSIYGIGNNSGYSSYSSYYSSLYNKKKNNTTNNLTDLQSLMKMADEVRSPAYAKKIKETIESGKNQSSGIGTVEAEANLSATASALHKSALSLNGIGAADISDKEGLVKKVNDFADAYNKTVEAMGKSDSVNALRSGITMTNAMKTYSGALKRIGITVGSDNKLTVDAEKLKAADERTVSSLLRSGYSPVARVADKSEDISKEAQNKAQTTAFRNMVYGNQNSSGTNKNMFGYGSYSGYNSYASSFLGSLFNSLG